MTNLLLAATIFLLSNLQKNPFARIAGRLLAVLSLYYALSSHLPSALGGKLLKELKTGGTSVEKITSKIMPKEVSSGQKSIAKTLKEVGDSIK